MLLLMSFNLIIAGSCWAFSSIGAIEGAHAIATGNLVSLSEQELVSCVHSNYGCNGGLMDPSFEWVMKNGGINTETGYPYVSGTGNSKFCRWIKVRRRYFNHLMYVCLTGDFYQNIVAYFIFATTCLFESTINIKHNFLILARNKISKLRF